LSKLPAWSSRKVVQTFVRLGWQVDRQRARQARQRGQVEVIDVLVRDVDRIEPVFDAFGNDRLGKVPPAMQVGRPVPPGIGRQAEPRVLDEDTGMSEQRNLHRRLSGIVAEKGG
jgi:hypothetical protein